MCFTLSLWILFTDAAMCLSVNGNDSGDTLRSFSTTNNTYFFHFSRFFRGTKVEGQGHFQRAPFIIHVEVHVEGFKLNQEPL